MGFLSAQSGWRADRDYNSSLNHLKHAGWEPPVVPVELRPLPITMGKAGQGSGKPLKDGVAHEVIDLESGMLYRIKEDEVRDFISKLSGRFEVRAPSLEDVYLEVMKSA